MGCTSSNEDTNSSQKKLTIQISTNDNEILAQLPPEASAKRATPKNNSPATTSKVNNPAAHSPLHSSPRSSASSASSSATYSDTSIKIVPHSIERDSNADSSESIPKIPLGAEVRKISTTRVQKIANAINPDPFIINMSPKRMPMDGAYNPPSPRKMSFTDGGYNPPSPKRSVDTTGSSPRRLSAAPPSPRKLSVTSSPRKMSTTKSASSDGPPPSPKRAVTIPPLALSNIPSNESSTPPLKLSTDVVIHDNISNILNIVSNPAGSKSSNEASAGVVSTGRFLSDAEVDMLCKSPKKNRPSNINTELSSNSTIHTDASPSPNSSPRRRSITSEQIQRGSPSPKRMPPPPPPRKQTSSTEGAPPSPRRRSITRENRSSPRKEIPNASSGEFI